MPPLNNMYYSYEINDTQKNKKDKPMLIISALIKILSLLCIVIGVLMYKNIGWCIGLIITGIIIASIGILAEKKVLKSSFVWQYVVNNEDFYINKRFANGEILTYISCNFADLKVAEYLEKDGYIVYNITIENDKELEIKSNKYLYALLRNNTK